MAQLTAEFNQQTNTLQQQILATQNLQDRLDDTTIELEQTKNALDISQNDLDKCREELDKCQTDLLNSQEHLSEKETELEMSKTDLSERDEQIAANLAEIAEKNKEIAAREEEIFQFKSQKYPERCTSLQEQLLSMSRNAQFLEKRTEGMEKERHALRMALLNEIEYLRSA